MGITTAKKEELKYRIVKECIKLIDKSEGSLFHDSQILSRENLKPAISPSPQDLITYALKELLMVNGGDFSTLYEQIDNSIAKEFVIRPSVAKNEIGERKTNWLRVVVSYFDFKNFSWSEHPLGLAYLSAEFYTPLPLFEGKIPDFNAAEDDVKDIFNKLNNYYQAEWEEIDRRLNSKA